MMEASSNSTAKGCCLKRCIKDPDANNAIAAEDCSRVEVKAFEPKKKKDTFLVNWASDGSARFHSECWRSLVKATKGSSTSSDELTDVERSMVLEAKKTAEFHDADSTVAEEAVRIASILKNCSYCVAFTGAGISTAAGYGDFRGINGTWTSRDRQQKFGKYDVKIGINDRGCNGYMMNTIINFGDDLEPDILRAAERHAELSDVALILGTSLRVSPANDLVMMGQQPHRLILCNRQITPYDDECTNGSRVFCDCDRLMAKVMEQLLLSSDLQKWEEERDTRMAEYALKRSTV